MLLINLKVGFYFPASTLNIAKQEQESTATLTKEIFGFKKVMQRRHQSVLGARLKIKLKITSKFPSTVFNDRHIIRNTSWL